MTGTPDSAPALAPVAPEPLRHVTAGRLVRFVRTKDPEGTATRRAVRTAVVVTASFGVARLLTPSPQFDVFAVLGAVALCMLVDFPGPRRTRLRSYVALVVTGVGFIALGTLCSRYPLAAVGAMAVVAFAVLFCGVLSSQVSASTTSALLVFVLPVTFDGGPGDIPLRLAGWLLAAALSVPACLLVWPSPYHNDVRRQLAHTARALATLVAAHSTGAADGAARVAAERQVADLNRRFQSTAHPPSGASAQEAAVDKLAGRLAWVAYHAQRGSGRAASLGMVESQQLEASVATVLDATADLVCDGRGRPVTDLAPAARLAAAADQMAVERDRTLARSLEWFEGTAPLRHPGGPVGPGTGDGAAESEHLLDALDPAFRSRALSYATDMVAISTFDAAGVVWSGRPEGGTGAVNRPLPATDVPAGGTTVRRQRRVERVRRTWGAVRASASSRATIGSVRLRNSAQGAVALALAVAVVEITSVSHGFWVILGTLAVLRSSAMDTTASATRALAGTVVGFAVGAALMVGVGSHTALLWFLLPVTVFVAALAPVLFSFAVAQAGFTMMVIVVFNIVQPTGWKIGLTRIEDVAIGCAVSVVVGLLFWPRGATAALGRALCDAYVAAADFFAQTVRRTTGVAPDERAFSDVERRMDAEYQRLDDAFHQYLAERGTKPLPVATVDRLFIGVTRTAFAGRSLASLPPPPDWSGLSPELAEARRDVLATTDGLQAWYTGAAETLAGRRRSAPEPPAEVPEIHAELVDAFDDTRARHPEHLRMAIRLLWVDESLDDQRTLVGDLGSVVEQFARRRAAHSA